jgi:hypothetical protein
VVSGAIVVVVGGAVVVVADVVVEVVVVVGRSVVVVRSVVSVGSRMSVSSSSPTTTLPIITGGHLRARPDTRPAHKLGLWMATPIVVCLRGRSTSVSEVGQWAARHEPILSDEDDCAAPALAGPRSTLTMKGRTA